MQGKPCELWNWKAASEGCDVSDYLLGDVSALPCILELLDKCNNNNKKGLLSTSQMCGRLISSRRWMPVKVMFPHAVNKHCFEITSKGDQGDFEKG